MFRSLYHMNRYPPQPDELADYMDDHGLTSRDVGALLRLSDPSARAVRHWLNGRGLMSWAQWFALRVLVEGELPVLEDQ